MSIRRELGGSTRISVIRCRKNCLFVALNCRCTHHRRLKRVTFMHAQSTNTWPARDALQKWHACTDALTDAREIAGHAFVLAYGICVAHLEPSAIVMAYRRRVQVLFCLCAFITVACLSWRCEIFSVRTSNKVLQSKSEKHAWNDRQPRQHLNYFQILWNPAFLFLYPQDVFLRILC